eukprot:m.118567 g.118567  ORF g.118567 m.118567 type:complete len:830 (-) comp9344_c0_seq1:6192-8681(-)
MSRYTHPKAPPKMESSRYIKPAASKLSSQQLGARNKRNASKSSLAIGSTTSSKPSRSKRLLQQKQAGKQQGQKDVYQQPQQQQPQPQRQSVLSSLLAQVKPQRKQCMQENNSTQYTPQQFNESDMNASLGDLHINGHTTDPNGYYDPPYPQQHQPRHVSMQPKQQPLWGSHMPNHKPDIASNQVLEIAGESQYPRYSVRRPGSSRHTQSFALDMDRRVNGNASLNSSLNLGMSTQKKPPHRVQPLITRGENEDEMTIRQQKQRQLQLDLARQVEEKKLRRQFEKEQEEIREHTYQQHYSTSHQPSEMQQSQHFSTNPQPQEMHQSFSRSVRHTASRGGPLSPPTTHLSMNSFPYENNNTQAYMNSPSSQVRHAQNDLNGSFAAKSIAQRNKDGVMNLDEGELKRFQQQKQQDDIRRQIEENRMAKQREKSEEERLERLDMQRIQREQEEFQIKMQIEKDEKKRKQQAQLARIQALKAVKEKEEYERSKFKEQQREDRQKKLAEEDATNNMSHTIIVMRNNVQHPATFGNALINSAHANARVLRTVSRSSSLNNSEAKLKMSEDDTMLALAQQFRGDSSLSMAELAEKERVEREQMEFLRSLEEQDREFFVEDEEDLLNIVDNDSNTSASNSPRTNRDKPNHPRRQQKQLKQQQPKQQDQSDDGALHGRKLPRTPQQNKHGSRVPHPPSKKKDKAFKRKSSSNLHHEHHLEQHQQEHATILENDTMSDESELVFPSHKPIKKHMSTIAVQTDLSGSVHQHPLLPASPPSQENDATTTGNKVDEIEIEQQQQQQLCFDTNEENEQQQAFENLLLMRDILKQRKELFASLIQ